jgi:hypothetical protein
MLTEREGSRAQMKAFPGIFSFGMSASPKWGAGDIVAEIDENFTVDREIHLDINEIFFIKNKKYLPELLRG